MKIKLYHSAIISWYYKPISNVDLTKEGTVSSHKPRYSAKIGDLKMS